MNALRDLVARQFGTSAFRLAVVGMSAFLIGAALVAFLLFRETNAVLTDQTLAAIRAEASVLDREVNARGIPGLVEAVRLLSRPEGPGLYFLADPSGAKLAGNLNRVPPEIGTSPAGGVFRFELGEGAALVERLGVGVPVPIKAGAILIVGRDVEEQRAFASGLKRTFLWGFVGLGIVGLLGGIAVGRSALRRIEAITAASRKIMGGNLAERMPLTGAGDEFDDLSQSLNAMLDRIEQLMAGLKEVSDNIAHDLKTPLTRMRTRAEAALRDARGPDACREGLQQTIEDADDLIKTFNALLLIAKLEAGAVQDSAVEFDLGTMVRDVAELYEPVADEEGQELVIVAGSGPTVRANRHLVGQAVANLIDNAIKYSSPGEGKAVSGSDSHRRGEIKVSVTSSKSGAEISVADRGPGISAADCDRALKRFVRLEQSRTQPGTGLGLSLVAAVARIHGGSIRLEDNEPGLRVVLVLPV